MNKYKLIEITMYGKRKYKVYQNINTNNYKLIYIDKQGNEGHVLYRKKIPSYLIGITI